MSSSLEVGVIGVPVPKGRPRMTRAGHVITPKRTVAWEKLVRLTVQSAASAVRWRPLDEPCAVVVEVRRARRAGDLDNFVKAILDACNGVLWTDDKLVASIQAHMIDGADPGVQIKVWPIVK